ncbi:sensor histidine kinase [Caulobacter sp. DWR2-3-1b2]|uniref:sensor histidine kinase n=1 Tax=unclassified Caulobacter TaxID=2648921 RepID=UPI003CFA3337
MPLARLSQLWRSTSFRISLIHAALLAAAIIGAVSGGWIATRGAAEREAHDRIALEVHAVTLEIQAEGLKAAGDAVMARAERPGALEYRLVDSAGRHVAGDLSDLGPKEGWRRLDFDGSAPGLEGKDRLLILTQRLPDGARLTVGEGLGRAEALRDTLFRTLLLWGGLALALGLAAGLYLTHRALERMNALVRTVRAVADGNLAARASDARPEGDDIGQLATGVNQMLDRIDVLVAAVRRVSADVAHDLRTPLSHVRQRLDTATTAATPELRNAALQSAKDGIDRAMRMFDAMLRLAEIDAGAARARFATVDLADLTDRVADAYRAELEASGRTLLVQVAGSLVVEGDADLLTQALANLLENVLKHSRAGAAVQVRLVEKREGIQLSVEDDGPGIPPEMFEVAVRPFSRLDPARAAPGTGLGLAIAAGVARLHGGRLLLEDARPGLRVTMLLAKGLMLSQDAAFRAADGN